MNPGGGYGSTWGLRSTRECTGKFIENFLLESDRFTIFQIDMEELSCDTGSRL